jgi:MoaA/NifB/PqqE/SkfB family radical SAM enzyme
MNSFESAAGEMLTIEVSTRCNSSCRHCFARAGRERDHELDGAAVLGILEEGISAGYRDFHITGGEPFMWGGLDSVLEKAPRMGYRSLFINSNGTLLTQEIFRRLVHSGLDAGISVSIQGNEDLHDSIRGEGSWGRARVGLSAALDAGVPVTVFTSVGRSLLPELPLYAGEIFTSFPAIKSLTLIQLIRVAGDSPDLSLELLDPGDFLRMVRMAAMLNLSGLRIMILENPLASAAASLMGMPWIHEAPPLHRPGRLVIMADGSMALSHSGRQSLGRYRPGMIRDVMDSGTYARATGADDEACGRCRHIESCRGCGMIRPSEWNRDMEEGRPYCVRVMDLAETFI